uniref:Uncharacterized protein n=1 Tax=Setaria viridis TaxID=4556 RepID=A0A4U6W129_SETVI|nr:hypothetical protein SEVIR_2G353250v2 [Setaria viridis]
MLVVMLLLISWPIFASLDRKYKLTHFLMYVDHELLLLELVSDFCICLELYGQGLRIAS